MKTFKSKRSREEALKKLRDAGWSRRQYQVESDFECFLPASGKNGMLLVDFALGRFILNADGGGTFLCERDEADGNPQFDAILDALYEGELVEAAG